MVRDPIARNVKQSAMFDFVNPRRTARCCATVLALCVAAVQAPLHAATVFPALKRPALQVKAPERQVMQAAAQAGARIVAIGERGLVVLSDDEGQTWRQARQVPVSTTLTAMSFSNDKLGWAVGHGGVVLHTRDGGETWALQADGATLAKAALQAAEASVQQSPDSPTAQRALQDARVLLADGPDKPLLDVHFQDARHGWVVGAYNLFFETADGGVTWKGIGSRLDNPKALHLNAIRAQGDRVVIVGEQGRIYRSLDNGQSFQSLTSPYKGSWFTLALPGDGSVVAAGLRGNAFRSPDGGNTWLPIEGAPPVSFLSATALKDGSVLLANQGGQLFSVRQGSALSAVPAPPVPMLTNLLVLRDRGLLAVGLGGVMRLAIPAQNESTK